LKTLRVNSRLDRITDWEDFAKQADYRVKEMARMAEVNRRQLPRFFLDRFGCSPQFWLQNLRLRLAKGLLAQGKPAWEIACQLGFKHETSFYPFFQRFTGYTPHAYGKSHPTNGSALCSKAVA